MNIFNRLRSNALRTQGVLKHKHKLIHFIENLVKG